MHTEFGLKTLRKEIIGISRRGWEIILKQILKIIGSEGVERISLAQDMENLWSDVNMVTNPLVP
jgi:DUF1009 family protein